MDERVFKNDTLAMNLIYLYADDTLDKCSFEELINEMMDWNNKAGGL